PASNVAGGSTGSKGLRPRRSFLRLLSRLAEYKNARTAGYIIRRDDVLRPNDRAERHHRIDKAKNYKNSKCMVCAGHFSSSLEKRASLIKLDVQKSVFCS